MSVSGGSGRSTLRILLDLRHPYAFLALAPAEAFGELLRIDIDWLPQRAPLLKPPEPAREGDDRAARHRRYRARATAREIETYAAAQGLALRDYYRQGDVEAAELSWLWVRERCPERLPAYLQRLFRAYWALELDASDPGEVAALVEESGADGGPFRDWSAGAGTAALAELRGELRELDLATPAYVLDDEVFYGRQHLPMIRWILQGRSGPAPI
ncbi:MAG: hypothetical protein J4G09_01730 [Proteobacteria bacterium]|nr:hypothetical protein [Pseudomonadota bacterium]